MLWYYQMHKHVYLRGNTLTRFLQLLDGLAVEGHRFSILTRFEALVTGLFELRPRLRAPLLRHDNTVTIKINVNITWCYLKMLRYQHNAVIKWVVYKRNKVTL